MTKTESRTPRERGTLVKCMGGSGVVVASSLAAPAERDQARALQQA